MVIASKKPTPIAVREYENILPKLETKGLQEACKEFALQTEIDTVGKYPPVLKLIRNEVRAQNYVGVLGFGEQKGRGNAQQIIEIYPKILLGEANNTSEKEQKQQEQEIFFNMLRHWRDNRFRQLDNAVIQQLKKYPMLEAFKFYFLQQVQQLIRKGIAHQYVPHQDNLPYLKGRLQFTEQIAVNHSNQARFFVQYDEYTPNRPANRLIRKTLNELGCRLHKNEVLRRQLVGYFDDIPTSLNKLHDWQLYQQHKSNRLLHHYLPVMRWVKLFLFGDGLATYQGEHENASLLFPMEQIFEDYVAHCIRRYCSDEKNSQRYRIKTQRRDKRMLSNNNHEIFELKPDISVSDNQERKLFILDTKWKQIDSNSKDGKFQMSQSDVYQMFAYGRFYGCEKVMLIYPKNEKFNNLIELKFNQLKKEKLIELEFSQQKIDKPIDQQEEENPLQLLLFPFDLENPEASTAEIFEELGDTKQQSLV